MNKWVNTVLCVLVLAGVVFAMTGATVGTETERGRWTAGAAGSVATEGGNISGVNVSSTSLTDRWASFYGNVTGAIVLRSNDSSAFVYSWSWVAADGGEVCLSQGGNFPWASAGATLASAIDNVFTFGAVADNATNTYSGGCNLVLDGVGPISTIGTSLMGNSSFENCALSDGVETAKADFAFCTNISNSGTNWNNESANYEVMVPTTAGSGTETYYFYVELN